MRWYQLPEISAVNGNAHITDDLTSVHPQKPQVKSTWQKLLVPSTKVGGANRAPFTPPPPQFRGSGLLHYADCNARRRRVPINDVT